MQCLQCHQENLPPATFCLACGVRLTHRMRISTAGAVCAGRATSLTTPALARPRSHG